MLAHTTYTVLEEKSEYERQDDSLDLVLRLYVYTLAGKSNTRPMYVFAVRAFRLADSLIHQGKIVECSERRTSEWARTLANGKAAFARLWEKRDLVAAQRRFLDD